MTKHLYTAKFASGLELTRRSNRTYTHAFVITGVWAGRPNQTSTHTGFAGSYILAQKQINLYTGPSSGWSNTAFEIVEVAS